MCPYCKEEVKQEAAVCKHCKSKLKTKKWHFATLVLLLVFLVPSLAYGSYAGYFYYDNTQKITKASEFEATEKYAEAINELNQALEHHPVSIQKRTILEKKNKMVILKKDNDNYNAGFEPYRDGNYEIAKSWFDLVGKESPKYLDAQAKSADCSAKITAATAKPAASTPKTTLKAAPASTISETQLKQNQLNSIREAKTKIAQGKIDNYNNLIALARKWNKEDRDKQAVCMEKAKKYIGTGSYDAWKANCDIYTPSIAKRDAEIIEYQKQVDFWLAQLMSY